MCRFTSLALVFALGWLGLTAPAFSQAPPLADKDDDIVLLDQHFALHLGGSIGAASFAVGALAVGIQALVEAGSEESTRVAQSRFVLGLTLTSMGVSTAVSSASSIHGSALHWKSVRKRFSLASPAQKRLLRERESARLRALIGNRVLAIVVDGSFLAVGVLLTALEATDLGFPLVLEGSLLLGVDIFRLVVDHQFSLRWKNRELNSGEGYFSSRALEKGLPIPLPFLLPAEKKAGIAGGGFAITSVF